MLLSHIPLLAAIILAVLVPMFVGHGLAIDSTGWMLAGIGALVAAACATLLTIRGARSRAGEKGSTGAHG